MERLIPLVTTRTNPARLVLFILSYQQYQSNIVNYRRALPLHPARNQFLDLCSSFAKKQAGQSHRLSLSNSIFRVTSSRASKSASRPLTTFPLHFTSINPMIAIACVLVASYALLLLLLAENDEQIAPIL